MGTQVKGVELLFNRKPVKIHQFVMYVYVILFGPLDVTIVLPARQSLPVEMLEIPELSQMECRWGPVEESSSCFFSFRVLSNQYRLPKKYPCSEKMQYTHAKEIKRLHIVHPEKTIFD